METTRQTHKLTIVKRILCETMQRKTYVSSFCVLLFLIIEDANVNALSLTSSDNPIENEVCNLTCTTTDHSRNVVFDKVPNTAIIGQCVSGVGCFAMSQYSIIQPTSVTTVLSFMHSRSTSGTWRCSYGPTFTSVSVPWTTLDLVSCDNPIENEVCNLTCTTINHSLNVAFNKVPDVSIIAQCDPDLGCSVTDQFNISQPDSITTVLSFKHSRDNSGTWRCSYGITPKLVSVPWATYPLTVSTTLTSNTTVDTNIDGNVTLGCLYSEEAPKVTLQYVDANGNNDAMSAEKLQCDANDIPSTDTDFTTYECPVVVKEETGIDNSDTYSIKLKIKVSHVQTEDVRTIATDITFKRSGNTSTPTGNSSGNTSTPTGNGSGGTSTSTGNKGIVFVMLFVFLLANYSMVDAVCFCTRSTANKSKNKLFDCCGSKSSLESEDDPGFFKDKVLTLKELVIGVGFAIELVLSGLCLPVVVWMLMKFVNNDASETSRSQSCVRNGTVTPYETGKSQKKSTFDKREQSDGDEGPQSTPKDPDARHLTTGRPLPRRPDIPSPQTGPFHYVNSPRPIVLAPIENPNIPPSIDTLDEQKAER